MAEDKGTEKKSHGAVLGQSVQDFVVHKVGEFLLKQLGQHREDKVQGKDPESQFASAMAMLYAKNRAAWQCITDVLANLAEAERKSFRTRFGRIGGPEAKETLAALEALADPALTLDDRLNLLRLQGMLNPVADPVTMVRDNALSAAVKVGNVVATTVTTAAEAVENTTATLKTIDDQQAVKDAAPKAKSFRQQAVDKLKNKLS